MGWPVAGQCCPRQLCHCPVGVWLPGSLPAPRRHCSTCKNILLFLQNRYCGAGQLFTGSGSRYLFTGSSSGSSSYKNWLTSSKKRVFSFTSQRRLRLRPKSTGSARLWFRLRSTVQNQGMLFLILFWVVGPNLELVPGFADPACSDWLSVYILYYTNGSSNRLLFSTRCCYPIILFSLIRGRPVFISFSGFYFLPEPVKHSDPCGSGSESLFNSSCCCSPVTY